jgi:hypothetical protein
VRPGLIVDDDALRDFCRRNRIRRLALFGSVLRDDFRSDSDVDLFVEFEPGATPGFVGLAHMELQLEVLFDGHRVDLRTYGDLSRYFRDEVRAMAKPVYDAVA